MTQTQSFIGNITAPFSQDLEEAVVGAVITDGTALFETLRNILRPRHFYLVRLRGFWQAFARIADRGDIIDMTSTVGELQDMGIFDPSYDYAYIAGLPISSTNSQHAETYAKTVHRMAMRRAGLEAADQLIQDALNESASVDVMFSRWDRRGLELRREMGAIEQRVETMDDFVLDLREMAAESEARHKENPDYVIGVRTGIHDLDLITDGLQPGITTLAAATGVGKTALSLQITRFAAQQGILRASSSPARVHFFSGEMTKRQLGVRMLSAMTGVPARFIQRGDYDARQKGLIEDAWGELLSNTHLTLEPGSRINAMQLRQRVRQMALDNEIDLLVLDGLLQIEGLKIDPSDSPKQQRYAQRQRRDIIEEIMNDLEDMALTYNLPILLTHQISRAPSNRENKRPVLSDLAEASFVEQKSAVILFLYREGYYNPDCPTPNAAEINVAKNRHGETGIVPVQYDREYTRFLDTEYVSLYD